MIIKEYVLKNEKLEVHFLNVGAVITKFIDLETGINIIVGHDNYEVYAQDNPGYMNAVIGRNAGRIVDFNLDGKDYQVTKNIQGLYQLHGGFQGFNKKVFNVETFANGIKFSTFSADGEEGYPGNVNFSITYLLNNDQLELLYEATTDQKTIMSFTHHAYFNLDGKPGATILNHELQINADRYFALDSNMLPLQAVSVEDTPLDFRVSKEIGKDMNANFEQLKITRGFDHPFLVKKESDFNKVATLKSKESNLILDVFSTEDVLVFYAGNSITPEMTLNGGVKGNKHYALCLETQGVPNSINIPEFKDRNLYGPSDKYIQRTIWRLYK
jgi:aldose 1-epimerase